MASRRHARQPEWSDRPTDADLVGGHVPLADRDSAASLLRSIMGWPQVVRFWLPLWIRDRAALLDQIDAAVAAANEPDVEERPLPETVDTTIALPEVPAHHALPRNATTAAHQVQLHRAACLIRGGHIPDGLRLAADMLDTLPAESHNELLRAVARQVAEAVPTSERRQVAYGWRICSTPRTRRSTPR